MRMFTCALRCLCSSLLQLFLCMRTHCSWRTHTSATPTQISRSTARTATERRQCSPCHAASAHRADGRAAGTATMRPLLVSPWRRRRRRPAASGGAAPGPRARSRTLRAVLWTRPCSSKQLPPSTRLRQLLRRTLRARRRATGRRGGRTRQGGGSRTRSSGSSRMRDGGGTTALLQPRAKAKDMRVSRTKTHQAAAARRRAARWPA